MLEHKYGEWTVLLMPTQNTVGFEERKCSVCSTTEQRVIPVLEYVNPFTDVKTSDYFYKPVLWAVETGITNGTGATTFSPNATCTSGQVVTFLYRSNNPGAAKEASNPYYANAVKWAEGKKLLSGTGVAFAPANNAPRSDIVYYLYRNSK